MTTLNVRSKDTLVGVIAAGMQGRLNAFLNFAVGSVLLAVTEAFVGPLLWLQAELQRLLRTTRASTSSGADLDTWMADWGLIRLPAVTASGIVTLTRYSAASDTILIPVGSVVQTRDGSQRYTVTADPTLSTYSPTDAGYRLYPGALDLVVPIQAQTAGTAGNVDAGAIALVGGNGISGIDTLSNPAALTNGREAESDDAFRARFVGFINSLSKATVPAIEQALDDLGLGLRYQILDNEDALGRLTPGIVTVYVDDGSGALPDASLALATRAVNAVRAGGVQVAVFRASILPARVQMTLAYAPGYYAPLVEADVTAALSAYINALAIGPDAPLPHARLGQIALNASPGVTNVTNITLNGRAADLVPAPGQTIRALALVVS